MPPCLSDTDVMDAAAVQADVEKMVTAEIAGDLTEELRSTDVPEQLNDPRPSPDRRSSRNCRAPSWVKDYEIGNY